MKIAIVGAGRMGSFFAQEFAKIGHEVAALDRDPSLLAALADVVTLRDRAELKQFEPDILLNAVPLQHTVEAFKELEQTVSPQVVLVDIASIKGELANYYPQLGRPFASLHPMFGPTYASMNQLTGHHCIVIANSDSGVTSLFRGLLENRGVTFSDASFAEHDQMMAYSLAVPFVS